MMDVIPGSLPAGAMVLERLSRGGRRHAESYLVQFPSAELAMNRFFFKKMHAILSDSESTY